MRSIISALITIMSLVTLAQRVTFNDPDLTFSFKKPKSWEVFDDGYSVKASPSAADSSNFFFSITYFESPTPAGEMTIGLTSSDEFSPDGDASFKIGGEKATYQRIIKDNKQSTLYRFYKLGQRFEVTVVSNSSYKKGTKTLRKIIKSIRIEE